MLGGLFFTTVPSAVNLIARDASIARQDSPAGDRDGIRAHVDKIFKAYIDPGHDSGATRNAER
jgi:hypothetical protein